MPRTLQALLIDASPPLFDAIAAAVTQANEDIALARLDSLTALDAVLAAGGLDCVLCALHPAAEIQTDDLTGGLAILEFIRKRTRNVPVILLLAAADEHAHAARAIALGADDYVFTESLARLPQALGSAVRRRRLLAQHLDATTEHRLALTVLQGSSDSICITNTDGLILLVNDALTRMSGYAAHELLGKTPRVFRSGKHDIAFYSAMWKSLQDHGCWQGSVINRHKDGSLYDAWLRISAVRDEEGVVTHFIAQSSYASEQRQLIDRIHHLARFDALTGLPNRNLFLDRLEQSLASARRNQRNVAVVLVQLDRFRQINDTLGHSVGDQVLRTMAQRLGNQIRQGDTVARLSGNEFSFIFGNLHAADDALNLSLRLQAAIALPVDSGGPQLQITASVGISVSPRDGDSGDDLLKAADTALVRAKASGGNCFSFYSPDMDTDARRRLAIELQLRQALANNEFHLLYQPQNNLNSGNIIGVEALLRWNNPTLGAVSPGEFIPIAEESGLIISIGNWVLRQACAQNKDWQDLGLPNIRVAVNVSTRQFRGEKLVDEVTQALQESGLNPHDLEIEITESALVRDIDAAIATSRQLKDLGVKLSLDDFGTGYSSLAYVSRFPLDKLKIDQSFIRDITHNPANAAIATAAIAIARGLNLSVLAEGVETEAQATFLRNHHCDAMQGYLFNHPLQPDAVAKLLAENVRLRLGAHTSTYVQTLLVVDDETSILSAMSRVFRHENYRVLIAQTAAEAFDLLARNTVQVVISDQRMAAMSGTEFFARVRQLYPDTLRIILTGYTELEAVMDAVNRGAVYKFLTKPWEDDQLREQVREAFRVSASKDAP